jgi:hypothetical protein
MVASIKSLDERQPKAAQVAPDKEYVAAAGRFSTLVGAALSTLFSDEAELRLGVRGYDALLTDPEIHKNVTLIVDAVLGDGVQLFSAFTDEKSDPAKAERAARVYELCRLNLFETPQRPFRQTLAEALKAALVSGHKVVEKTYRDYRGEGGRPLLVLDKLKLKARGATQFVVDPYLNVLGLQVWDGARLVVVPRSKFFIPTFDRVDEDPRGSAPAMRAAYNWFVAKRAGLPVCLKRLEKKAIPSTVGFTAEGEDAGLTLGEDADSKDVRTPQQVMAHSLAELENGSAAAFVGGNGAKVQVLDASGNGTEFRNFFEMCNGEITRAQLLSTLATNEGRYGPRAQSMTHMSVLDLRIWNLKNSLAEDVRGDILRDVVYINEGPDAVALTPAVSLGDTERRDWATDARAAAIIAPFVPDSIWAAICKQLGLPAPAEGESWPSRGRRQGAEQQGEEDPDMTEAEGLALHRNLASALRGSARLRKALEGVN